MAGFKYDLIALLELVAARPCIWNKRSEQYRNKFMKEASWQEIFRILDDTYDNQSMQRQRKNGETIMQKWINVRDAFIRSLKIKSGKEYRYADHLQFLVVTQVDDAEPDLGEIIMQRWTNVRDAFVRSLKIKSAKEYCYADHLQFLLGTQADRTDTDAGINEEYVIKEEYNGEEDESLLSNIETLTTPRSFQKKTKTSSEFGFEFLETEPKRPRLVAETGPRAPEEATLSPANDDENFFASYMPYIKNMTEDEKLDLHLEIITSIKKIRRKRVSGDSNHTFPTTSTNHY